MRKIKNFILIAAITLLLTQLLNAAGDTISLGGRVTGLTQFGYIVLIGMFLSIIGLGIRVLIKRRRNLD